MIFNQFEFLFVFLPAVLLLYYTLNTRTRILQLIVASLIFYGISPVKDLAILVFDIMWVYFWVSRRSFAASKFVFSMALAMPLVLLFYYKYLDFFLHMFTSGKNADTASLPVGISFFTFHLVSYVVDRFRNKVPTANLQALIIYIMFFPQLVAGPIVRYGQVEKAIAEQESFRPTFADIMAAIAYLSFGLGAKVLIADYLHNTYQPLIQGPLNEIGLVGAVFIVLAYTFQIYFDFYGYSLMAIGLGRFFGFHLPRNFDKPYSALNPREFWRRWHMSLSFWIRDYLYLPLGGNRNYIRNILIVFAACGLWHGAGWNYIAWGLYHGALIIGFSLFKKWYEKMPALMQVSVNFLLVGFGWILFLFNFHQASLFIRNFSTLDLRIPEVLGTSAWVSLGAAALVCWGANFERWIEGHSHSTVSTIIYALQMPAWFVFALTRLTHSPIFIYFRF